MTIAFNVNSPVFNATGIKINKFFFDSYDNDIKKPNKHYINFEQLKFNIIL
jgi:hypothetical protein